ncbi:isocitrate/isopropylmalate dehydrogenase family protein [Methanofollis aquaemaris]|uniref:Isocitrate/isopropylmalate dehydrogenase family protein n=1 Tax=Methanofollis aquaemaris TaxID=126734 RepID=A0A8A3S4T9_9EURY|nr:isocitrate/isopropylmalate family dehydrogenase [Methanofollis aquaemaris]QSZ67072.1 isocitrate/isopropylmalate dehydrogenase family protein [Methanofollis aquaemaris]
MKVAVVPGDGIGEEVVPVAEAALRRLHPEWDYFPVEVGYGRWKRCGAAIGAEELRALRDADAVLFGAVTTPPDPDYRSVIVMLRKELGLYANIRPVRGPGADLTIVRENTEGLYSGIEWDLPGSACTLRVVTEVGSRRIARFAAALAKGRRLTIGTKANVLKSDALFRRCAVEEAEAAGVEWEEKYIDALCLDVLMHPDRYAVVVTTNIFGDILSDAAASLVGGLGLLPSANIGDDHALFEPVHGSAPDIAGQGIANPVAALRSAAMLLDHAGDREGAAAVEAAVESTLGAGVKTSDLGGSATTVEFGEAVLGRLG